MKSIYDIISTKSTQVNIILFNNILFAFLLLSKMSTNPSKCMLLVSRYRFLKVKDSINDGYMHYGCHLLTQKI